MIYLKILKQKLISFLKRRLVFFSRSTGRMPIVSGKNGFIINFTKGVFLTTHARPKYASNILSESTNSYNERDYAFVIQGPIGSYSEFLYETILLYNQLFPRVLIIVSTWKDEDSLTIKKIEKLGAVVLQTEIPDSSGLFNVDLQTLSTSVGLDFASKKGVRFCIKTRPDCRIYKSNTISFLKSMLKTFPVELESKISSRIIASSVASCKYRVYGLTDIFLFGATQDLQRYFSPVLHKEWLKKNNLNVDTPLIEGTPVISEIFLCARYLDSLDIELQWSLEHWWECLKDFFCIVDNDAIDLFWYKHDWSYEKRFTRAYGYKNPRSLEFSDWLTLFAGETINWDKIDYKEKWVEKNGKLEQEEVI